MSRDAVAPDRFQPQDHDGEDPSLLASSNSGLEENGHAKKGEKT